MNPSARAQGAIDQGLEQVNDAVERLTFGAGQRPRQPRKGEPRFRRIVLAYDGSEGSELALEWARDLARSHDASVTLATTYAPPAVATADAMGYAWYPQYAEVHEAVERRARTTADRGAELLRGLDVDATSVVAEGSTGREIARIAAETHADLVVTGATHGGRFRRAVMGSTATALLHRAACSVLVARGPARPPRILVAVDGSHASFRAVAYAFHRASQTGAELTVLHVLDYPTESVEDMPPEGFVKAVAQRLELPAAPPKVRYLLDVGRAATRILMLGGEEDVGLIVLGSHGKDAVERLFVGSTSQRVANESHASVLVVKDA